MASKKVINILAAPDLAHNKKDTPTATFGRITTDNEKTTHPVRSLFHRYAIACLS